MSLILSVARNIPLAHNHLILGGWTRWKYIGTEVTGKNLGIFGIGRIETEVAKRAKDIGMNVVAYDPYVNKNEIKK